MAKLTKAQQRDLRGETGPYSEAQIVIQDRVLDDAISSQRIEVTCNINPLTYDIVSQNKKIFKDNKMICDIIETARDWGLKHGRVACPFRCPAEHPQAMNEAIRIKKMTTEALLAMHQFVMKLLDIKNN